MSDWIHEHKETLSILLLILFALLAGVAAGFMLIVIANLIRIW